MRRARPLPAYKDLLALPVRRVLAIKPRALGDVILSSIVTKNLRDAFPDATIDFLTEAPAREVIEGNPFIDNTIVFHPKNDSFFSLLRRVHRTRYDLVFDLFCNPRTAQITWATRARFRVGYPFRGRSYAYNVHVQTRADRVHNAIFNLDPLAALGIPITDRNIHFPLSEESREFARRFFDSITPARRPVIALNAHCAFEIRMWGSEHFAQLGDALAERHDATIILLHGPGEEEETIRIRGMMRAAAVLAPKTTVRQLGAVLERCDYLVTNDTGPMHIGAAVGLPVLEIAGPTSPERQGPFNTKSLWVRRDELDCLECNLRRCPIDHPCMRGLDVERVLDAFERLRLKNA